MKGKYDFYREQKNRSLCNEEIRKENRKFALTAPNCRQNRDFIAATLDCTIDSHTLLPLDTHSLLQLLCPLFHRRDSEAELLSTLPKVTELITGKSHSIYCLAIYKLSLSLTELLLPATSVTVPHQVSPGYDHAKCMGLLQIKISLLVCKPCKTARLS